MTEKFVALPQTFTQKDVTQAVPTEGKEIVRCVCPGDHWDKLYPLMENGFPFVEAAQAVRHEVQFQHARDRTTTGGNPAPTLEDLSKIDSVGLEGMKLLPIFVASPFATPAEFMLAAFPEVVEEAAHNQRARKISQAREIEIVPRKQRIVEPLSEEEQKLMEYLYEHYYDNVYRQVFHRVKYNPDTAEEFTSIVFMKAVKAIHTFDPEKSKAADPHLFWLLTIANNYLKDYYSGRREITYLSTNVDQTIQAGDESDPEVIGERSFNNVKLGRAINKLKNLEWKTVIVLRHLQGMDYSEIAARLNKSEAAARIMMHRALKAVKANLEDDGFVWKEARSVAKTPLPKKSKLRGTVIEDLGQDLTLGDYAKMAGVNYGLIKDRVLRAEKEGKLKAPNRRSQLKARIYSGEERYEVARVLGLEGRFVKPGV